MTDFWIKVCPFILFICIFIAAFFSGTETAVISTSKLHLKYLAKRGNKKAIIVSNLIQKPDKFLRVVLIGTNIAVIVASTVSSALAMHIWGDRGVTISILFTTLIILVFCEIIPKTIAQNNSQKISLKAAYCLKIASYVLYPIEVFFSWISNFIIRIFTGKKYVPLNAFFTKKDLKLIFEVGEKEGVLEKKEQSMIERILNLNDIFVKNVMIPQKYMVAVEENTCLEEAVKLMKKEGLSRVPVYQNNINNIIGFIYAKDFLIGDLKKKLSKSINLLGLIHPPYLVSESKRVTTLLKEFQRKKVHIAVVINKENKISGVVTIEDLLEEIFGEIEDEFDKAK
ncbi:MAG: hemolysin family protein [Candidatus Atribacteria bacterium]|nr:hemolysin family protein [bacterium]MCG2761649.1 hemolysin family protein [Candidatus Atribacteria bacterium]